MADKFARAALCRELEPALAQAIAADARAREMAARAAAQRCLRAELPAKLAKQFTDTLISFQMDLLPKLSALAADLSIQNVLGDARKVGQAHVVQAAAAVRAAVAGAYPEFDFEPLRALEDDFRGLLLGHTREGTGLDTARTKAAQLFEEGLKRIQAMADAFRSGAPPPSDRRDLFKPQSFYTFLDDQHGYNTTAIELVSALADRLGPSSGGGGRDVATLPSGKSKLNTLFGKWRDAFGDACIYQHATGHCKHGATCDKKHDPPLDAAKVLAWVEANNADVARR